MKYLYFLFCITKKDIRHEINKITKLLFVKHFVVKRISSPTQYFIIF